MKRKKGVGENKKRGLYNKKLFLIGGLIIILVGVTLLLTVNITGDAIKVKASEKSNAPAEGTYAKLLSPSELTKEKNFVSKITNAETKNRFNGLLNYKLKSGEKFNEQGDIL